MPHHKQFKKALIVNEKSRIRNHAVKSRLAKAVKNVRSAQSREEAESAFKAATSIIDSTASKGMIKKNTAARKKSRLSSFIARMEA